MLGIRMIGELIGNGCQEYPADPDNDAPTDYRDNKLFEIIVHGS